MKELIFFIFFRELKNVLVTVLKKQFFKLKHIINNLYLMIFDVLNTVLNIISNILLPFFYKPLFTKKERGNKKVTFLG